MGDKIPTIALFGADKTQGIVAKKNEEQQVQPPTQFINSVFTHSAHAAAITK